MPDKRLTFVINTAAFFVSHRLPIALAAANSGYDVSLIVGRPASERLEAAAFERLRQNHIQFFPTAFRSSSLSLSTEVPGFLQVLRQLRRLRPLVVHTVTPKGGLYGGLAARVLRVPALVVAISGMGYLFTGDAGGLKRRLARVLYQILMRFVYAHPNKMIIVQNSSDRQAALDAGARPEEVFLIPGSGVDLELFSPANAIERQPYVILPARLLRDKGVVEFVAAARILKNRGSKWRFVLVGTIEADNPTVISAAEIESWVAEGSVEWWGYREDMPAIFASAGIVCLPSYREGMPRALLEAAAAGCPIVTTDEPGCREAIIPGETGDLVPPRNAEALAEALQALIDDPERRERYGKAGRDLACRRYGIKAVVDQTLAIYDRLLSRAGR